MINNKFGSLNIYLGFLNILIKHKILKFKKIDSLSIIRHNETTKIGRDASGFD